jgi:hypothetical protein
MINIMQEFQFIGAIYHLFTIQSMGHTFLSQNHQEYLIKTTIIIKLWVLCIKFVIDVNKNLTNLYIGMSNSRNDP